MSVIITVKVITGIGCASWPRIIQLGLRALWASVTPSN